jgi:uncharacterized membrane protein YedE/YeeE
MTDQRLIAADALFMVLYIGLAAVFVGMLAVIGLLYAAGYDLDPAHISAAVVGVTGLFVLPVLPRLYRMMIGQPFAWRENTVLGGFIEK